MKSLRNPNRRPTHIPALYYARTCYRAWKRALPDAEQWAKVEAKADQLDPRGQNEPD